MPASQSLITVSDLRSRFGLPPASDIPDPRLTQYVRAASRRLRSWVGSDAYADALLLADNDNATNPNNPDRALDLQDAEAALAMHFAVLNLNTNITPGGVVLSSKEDGQLVIQYASPAQTSDLAAQWLNQAEELTRPWSLLDGTPDSQIAFV